MPTLLERAQHGGVEDGTWPTGVNVLWPQNHFQVQPVLGSWAAREHGRALHLVA